MSTNFASLRIRVWSKGCQLYVTLDSKASVYGFDLSPVISYTSEGWEFCEIDWV